MTALHISVGGPQALPIDLLLAAIPSLPRAMLNQLVDRAIEHMDEDDGDVDVEANGDELDGDNSEDAFWRAGGNVGIWGAPGCPISDPDLCVDDFGEDDRVNDC